MKGTKYVSALAGYFQNRRARRAAGEGSKHRPRRASPFRVESLEARLLLSADLAGAVQQTPVVQAAAVQTQQQVASAYVEGVINVAQAEHDGGYAYLVRQDFGTAGDTAAAPTASVLKVYENGVELGPAHAQHVDIRQEGQGQFSHWGNGLWFSASDNSNPLTNGRTYTYGLYTGGASSPTASTPSANPTATAPVDTGTPSTGRVFYVSPGGSDANSGTQAAPWRTIQEAAQQIVAGDTAILMDGVYEEGSITFANSGTAGNPITIKAQNKWGAILNSTSGGDPAFSIAQSYITIEDLRISVSPNSAYNGSYTSANAAIRAWDTSNATPSSPSTGTQGFVARGLLIDASSARDTGIKTNQDFSLIENCVVYNEIEVFNTQGSVVRNNTVYSGSPNGTHIVVKGGARNTLIDSNEIHITAPTAVGIYMGTQDFAYWDTTNNYTAYDSVASNNRVINEGSGMNVGLFGFSGSMNCVMSNNTGIGGQIFMAPGYQGLLNVNPTFVNNTLIAGPATEATGGYNGWDGYWTGTLTFEGNTFSNYKSGIPS